MYILVDKDNVVMHISNTIGKQENGYYLIKEESIAIPPEFVKEVYEVDEVPTEVEANKYCYTKKDGFYKNPDYKKYYSTEERLEIIEQMMNEIILGEE